MDAGGEGAAAGAARAAFVRKGRDLSFGSSPAPFSPEGLRALLARLLREDALFYVLRLAEDDELEVAHVGVGDAADFLE